MVKEKVDFSSLPDSPGVYFFIGKRREILYIGKATSLRSRVRSYFSDDIVEKRSPLIENMIREAVRIEVTQTDSVLEALLLETNLIRTHKPRYNTISKDDKSFNHIVITKEEYPRVLIVRSKDLQTFNADATLYEFGPFPSATILKDIMRIVRKLFQFYDDKGAHITSRDTLSKMRRGTINFNQQIGLYPSEETKESYMRTIHHIALLFAGKKHRIINDLQRTMMRLAKKQRFEEATHIKKQLFALTHIQDVSLIREDIRRYSDEKTIRIEAYDIAHLRGAAHIGVMTVVYGKERATHEYRTFTIRSVEGAHDIAALKEVISRRLEHTEWEYPGLIVVDGGIAQRNAAEAVLRNMGIVIPVVAVVKDEHHRPKNILGSRHMVTAHHDGILLANSESHRFAISRHRIKRDRIPRSDS